MKFFKNNIPVFFTLLVLLILGNIHPIVGSVVLAPILLFWAIREKNDWLILIFAFIIILGDNRLWFLLPFKGFRYVALSVLFIKTLMDLQKGRYRFNPLLYYSFPFFFVALLGLFLSPIPITAFSKTVAYFFLLFVCLNFLPYYLQKYNHKLLKNFLSLCMTVYAFGLVMILVDPGFSFLLGRYRGVFGNPNGLGIFSTIMVPFAFMMAQKFPSLKKKAYIVVLLGILSLILAESRTAFGCIGLFFLLYLIYKGGKMRKRFFWFFLLPVIVFVFTSVPLEQLVGMVGLEEYLRVESIKTGTGRYMAWGFGLIEIGKNMWIGRGFGYEAHYFWSLRDFFLHLEHQGGMHNSFLTFLMNNGILGFVPFVIFLIVMFRRMKAPQFGFPFVIITLISANFESWLNASLSAFTFFFYMVIVFMMNYQKIRPTT